MSQESVARRDGSAFTDDSVDGFIHRAFMRGGGRSREEVTSRPVVGICSSWSELNPCNAGLASIAEAVKRGVLATGGLPLVFPTISISEPFIRPSSMLLRNLMAMDVEQMIRCSPIDVVVLLGGCDKTVPAQLMGAISAGRPALALTSGPRVIQRWKGEPLTVDDLWPLADERRRGVLSSADWSKLEGCLNGGVGTCNVMGTAVTMAAVAEMLGFALPGTALLPAQSSARAVAAEQTGRRAVQLWHDTGGESPATVSRESLENAFRMVCALSGSTNALVHLAAIAGRAGIELSFDELAEWSRSTPVLTDLRPSGTHLLADLDELGGIPAVARELATRLHLDERTASGATWRTVIDQMVPSAAIGALRTMADPVQVTGALAMLKGTLAPAGAVIKRSAADPGLLVHTGRAVVFDSVEDMHRRIDDPTLDVDADSVLVLRGAGPRGGPGMPEVGHLSIPTTLLNAGVRDMVRVSDARMSGTATGTVVLHIAPEAAAGGPLALVRDGDLIALDVEAGTLDLLVADNELAMRQAVSEAVSPERGYDRLYWDHVLQAPEGCDFDFLRATRMGQGS